MESRELGIIYAYGDLLSEVSKSQQFKTFCTSFIFHFSNLCYCLLRMALYRTVWDLKYYVPRVGRYIGSLVGILSIIICAKSMSVSSGYMPGAIYLTLTGCMLSTIAALLAYGLNGTPNSVLGYSILIVSIIITLLSVNERMGNGEDFGAQSCVGIFHILMALKLLTMNFRRTQNVPGVPWHIRNGHIDQT